MDTRLFAIAFLAIALSVILAVSAVAADIAVITAGDTGEKVTAKTIERIFLKRKIYWKNGKKIVPINLPSGSGERVLFTSTIIKRGHRELVDYWNARHFSGMAPPMVAESEEAVKIFVKEIDGSVGYIRAENLDPEFKVLYLIREGQ